MAWTTVPAREKSCANAGNWPYSARRGHAEMHQARLSAAVYAAVQLVHAVGYGTNYRSLHKLPGDPGGAARNNYRNEGQGPHAHDRAVPDPHPHSE